MIDTVYFVSGASFEYGADDSTQPASGDAIGLGSGEGAPTRMLSFVCAPSALSTTGAAGRPPPKTSEPAAVGTPEAPGIG
jgi:hypothetical protein